MLKRWLQIFLIFSLFLLAACSDDAEKDTDTKANEEDTEVEIVEEDTEDTEEEEETDEEELANLTDPNRDGGGGFLWKTEANGNTVYMLGSIHVATEDFYPLHGKLEWAFAQSDYLAVEADVLNVNVFEMSNLVNEKAMYQDGTTLDQVIPEDLYAKVEEHVQQSSLPLPMAMLNEYEPWYIYNLIDSLQVMEFGYDTEIGIDMHFLNAATEQEMEIIEIESIEFQLDMLDSLSEEVQISLLESTIENSDNAKDEIDTLANLWKNGDEEGLEEYLLSEEPETEAEAQFLEVLLDDRNVGMTDTIEQFLQEGNNETYFVIVGAAHYFGEQGILQLLEDRGYTINKEL